MVINPYTFVALPEVWPDRKQQVPGHEELAAEQLAGSFIVDIRAETPLLLGPIDERSEGRQRADEVAEPPREHAPAAAGGGRVIVPGSSLMGAIRTLHETMNNSCLRILDLDYVAVHRLAMTTTVSRELRAGGRNAKQGLKMAVVAEAEASPGFDSAGSIGGDVPVTVRLVSNVVWVNTGQFTLPPRTGDRVDLDDALVTTTVVDKKGKAIDAGRKLYTGVDGSVKPSDAGAWIVLVTDTHARPSTGKTWFACGLVNDRASWLPLTTRARERFARAVEGSADLHGDHRPTTAMIPVTDPSDETVVVGHRRHAASIGAGTPVWVCLDETGGRVVELRLSVAWRRTSTVTLGDRIGATRATDAAAGLRGDAKPTGWEPCRTPAALCPTCRVFGSAGDDDTRLAGPAAQNSYRGHVRIDDAVALGLAGKDGQPDGSDVVYDEVTVRAPLSSPRPTAGQFYLDNEEVTAHPEDHPIAQWDSDADGERKPEGGRSAARPIRGRKYYWRTSPALPRGDGLRIHRSKARQDPPTDDPGLVARVRLVRPGAVFRTRVTFENLTPAEVGALIAAVCPQKVLTPREGKRIVISIGGGKPLGWGSARTSISDFRVWSARSRYAGDRPPDTTLSTAVAAYREAAEPWEWRNELWEQLGVVLSLGAVPDSEVWYPIPAGTQRGTAEYDKSYAFFGDTVGLWSTKHQELVEGKPLVNLPEATAEWKAQRLPGRGKP